MLPIPKARGVPSVLGQRHRVPCLIVPVEHGCKTPAPRAPRRTRLAVQQTPIAGASRHAPRVRGRAQRNRSASVTSGGRQKLLELGTEPNRDGLVFRCLGHLFEPFGLVLWETNLNHAGVAGCGVFGRASCHDYIANGIILPESELGSSASTSGRSSSNPLALTFIHNLWICSSLGVFTE